MANWAPSGGLRGSALTNSADAHLDRAILCVDSYIYFGTDDHFLNYILKSLAPGGTLAVAMPGLMKDFEDGVPQHLKPFWGQDCWCWHRLEWWRHLWERTGLVDMVEADTLPDGCALYARWKEAQDKAGLSRGPRTLILKQDAERCRIHQLAARKSAAANQPSDSKDPRHRPSRRYCTCSPRRLIFLTSRSVVGNTHAPYVVCSP